MHFPRQISPGPEALFILKTFSVVVALLFPGSLCVHAQLSDDFSDREFQSNPPWYGTSEDFIVNASAELQLQASVAGTSWLTTPLTMNEGHDVVWTFRLKQAFAPSGANYSRVYLMSDQQNLSAPLNGYYLRFGEAGSADAITLLRQTGGTSSTVCRGTEGYIAAAFDIVVQVVRTVTGRWFVYAGPDVNALELQAEGEDLTHSSSLWFGLRCTYTVTNATRIYFDDLEVTASPASDTTPPDLLSVVSLPPSTLRLQFSEPVAESSVTNPTHYRFYPGAVHPETAKRIGDTWVELGFAAPFPNGTLCTIEVNGVTDVAGNAAENIMTAFFYFQPLPVAPGDIVINEVMADPSPTVGLPEEEYVELFNRSINPVSLEGWLFEDDRSSAPLPDVIIPPGDFLVLCRPGAVAGFTNGPVSGVANFPALNNAGDRLRLISQEGNVVDSVQYTSAWYRDSQKAEGGWSLERIDPDNLCETSTNWAASESPDGGTPGYRNSVFAHKPDNRPPYITQVYPDSDRIVVITFNEVLDLDAPVKAIFRLSPEVVIDNVSFRNADRTALELSLANPLAAGQLYEIVIEEVRDCAGNRMDASPVFTILLPQPADKGDIVVNEVLFNPRPGGADFVELYNTSAKIIDLQHFSWRNVLSTPGRAVKIFPSPHLLGPGEYIVLTQNPGAVTGAYVHARAVVQAPLPALNDVEGALALFTGETTIDSVYYHENFHSPFVFDPEGVALERIDPSQPGYLSSNWRSASSADNFATPGYPNSNRRSSIAGKGEVFVEPELIRSGVPGLDFARVRYDFGQQAYMATVHIFDAQGRTVRELADNQLIAGEGFFRWDGDFDDGAKARTGYYFVMFSIFRESGEREVFRKRVAVF